MVDTTRIGTPLFSPTSGRSTKELLSAFTKDGYLTFPAVVDSNRLTELAETLRLRFEKVKANGELFRGGGTKHGHLNCFPGAESRFVYEALAESGVLDVVRDLSPAALRLPNIGCNFNLPHSLAQNEHIDGYAAEPFLVVNVAAVDTDITNGAIEIIPGTHCRPYKYWQLLLDRPKRLRLAMKRGDVLIRTSTLWHRGMPNLSDQARPMLAFSWEDGGSLLPDPYSAHGGQITFLPNRHRTDWSGRLRERAFIAAPGVGTAFLVVKSLIERETKAAAKPR